MPNLAFGAQKVVTGLSRVASPSADSISSLSSSDSSTSSLGSDRDDHAFETLSSALFGTTPPSDVESTASLSACDSDSEMDDIDLLNAMGHSAASSTKRLLAKIFPSSSTIHSLPSTTVDLSSIMSNDKMVGLVSHNAVAGQRTLFVLPQSSAKIRSTTFDTPTICALLEMAEEDLGCTGVILVLPKAMKDLGETLHSLLYVGGVVASGGLGAWDTKRDWLLVGLDL